jgi:arylsulfatase A-like enzyme
VLVADHTNQVGYPEYEKSMNRFAVPILFYSPNPKYQLQGEITEPAQQMDIYPTLADLMGYKKKIRSWGRSLVSDKKEDYMIINSDSINEQFMIGNYIYLFNGKEVTGIYMIDDKGLEKNLLNKVNNPEIQKGILLSKGWYQDYMNRVINRKLN